MIRKFYLFFFIIITSSGCGFSPIFSGVTDFQIKELKLEGDSSLNNFINMNLSRYSNLEKDTKYNIFVKTKYEKIILSKSATGSPTDYELIAIVNFEVNTNDSSIKTFNYEKKFNMESMTSKFEEKKFEKIQKQNFADIISNEFINDLSNI